MKIYVAGCLERVAEAAALAAEGHQVTSTWHADARLADPGARAAEGALAPDARRAIAARNHADLAAAHALVWLADPRSRGALVELGGAIHARKIVLAVGDPLAVTPMALHDEVRWYPDVAALLAATPDGHREATPVGATVTTLLPRPDRDGAR